MQAKESTDTLGKSRNYLLTFPVNGGLCKSNLVSTDNFTLEQEEEEGELGTNMAAPVGAPSYVTPYFPLSSIDTNSTRQ